VNPVEDRVRAAMSAAGDQAAREIRTAPPLRLQSPSVAGDRRGHSPRRWMRWGAPLTAAAAVAVVAVSLVVVRGVQNDSTVSAKPAASTGAAAAGAPVPDSSCAPTTVASASGGPASALTSAATEVASGTTGGQAWTLWSKKGETGARGIEDGGLVVGGRAYGLCPGYPNPAELELADVGGGHGLAFGVVGYPGLAKVWLYKSTVGTFETGERLPSPQVQVVDGVSFFIGALPQSACDYRSLELNSTSPGASDEHNLGFGACTSGRLVPITASQGIWQLQPGHFVSNFPGGSLSSGRGVPTANVPGADSSCSPPTKASASGGPASALTSAATEVASGTTGGQAWTLWSKKGETGARGIEDGGLVVDSRAYGLCPGYPNPAELELADIGGRALVYGVVGYPGLAKVWLYKSTVGTFETGEQLPSPQVQVVDGVSFFIGALPQSACDYQSLELNSTSPGVSDEHNLGFGACTSGRPVPITASQGIWQLPPGHFVSNFPDSRPSVGAASIPAADSSCSPTTVASASGGPASALTSAATEVASGTTSGQAWTLWSKKGETGARGIEDGGLVVGGRAYGLCPGFPNPAELELADVAGGHGLAFGVVGYPGAAKVRLYQSTTGTFDTGQALPSPQVQVVDGVSFFIGALPQSACDYRSLELNATSPGVTDQHNLGFGACTAGRLVPITASQGAW